MTNPITSQTTSRSQVSTGRKSIRVTLTKMPNAGANEQAQLEDLARRIVNKLLHEPVQALRKGESMHGASSQYIHAMQQLFKLSLPDHAPRGERVDDDPSEI